MRRSPVRPARRAGNGTGARAVAPSVAPSVARAGARVLALGTAALGVAMLALAACADSPTGAEPFSLTFDELPFPAVVAGDTLRDATGAAAPLRARVFGGDGNEIPDAEASYLVLDRGAHLETGNYVFGDSAGPLVRVVAEAAGIPSQPLELAVVLRPDSLSLASPTVLDTALFTPGGRITPTDTSARIAVRVLHRPTEGDPVGVGRWVVRYDVELYDGTTVVENDSLALLVGENGRLSVLDTTDTQGAAWRRLLLNGARPAIDAVDSAVVSVTILGRPAGTVSPPGYRVMVPIRSR